MLAALNYANIYKNKKTFGKLKKTFKNVKKRYQNNKTLKNVFHIYGMT